MLTAVPVSTAAACSPRSERPTTVGSHAPPWRRPLATSSESRLSTITSAGVCWRIMPTTESTVRIVQTRIGRSAGFHAASRRYRPMRPRPISDNTTTSPAIAGTIRPQNSEPAGAASAPERKVDFPCFAPPLVIARAPAHASPGRTATGRSSTSPIPSSSGSAVASTPVDHAARSASARSSPASASRCSTARSRAARSPSSSAGAAVPSSTDSSARRAAAMASGSRVRSPCALSSTGGTPHAPQTSVKARSLRRRRFAARNGSPAHDLSHVSGRLRRSAGRGGFSVVGEQMTKFGPRGPHGPPETAMRIDLSPL